MIIEFVKQLKHNWFHKNLALLQTTEKSIRIHSKMLFSLLSYNSINLISHHKFAESFNTKSTKFIINYIKQYTTKQQKLIVKKQHIT